METTEGAEKRRGDPDRSGLAQGGHLIPACHQPVSTAGGASAVQSSSPSTQPGGSGSSRQRAARCWERPTLRQAFITWVSRSAVGFPEPAVVGAVQKLAQRLALVFIVGVFGMDDPVDGGLELREALANLPVVHVEARVDGPAGVGRAQGARLELGGVADHPGLQGQRLTQRP